RGPVDAAAGRAGPVRGRRPERPPPRLLQRGRRGDVEHVGPAGPVTATAPVVGGARVSRARPVASAAERLERRRRLTGFSMALPPVVIIALFVGFPVLLAIGFSFGMTGGLNSTSAAIGQNVHGADGLITLDAYRQLFADARFPRDLLATILVTVV